MIRCVRIWTGDDGNSRFEEGHIDLAQSKGKDNASEASAAQSISFRESPPKSGAEPHTAPRRQFVITLSGTLVVRAPNGQEKTMHPGEIILAEDSTGSGHTWQLVDDQPWRRAYVVLGDDIDPRFVPCLT